MDVEPKLDGQEQELRTPIRLKVARNTVYTIQLTKENYESDTRKLEIKGGGVYSLSAHLLEDDSSNRLTDEDRQVFKERLGNLPAENLERLRKHGGHVYLAVAERTDWESSHNQCKKWGAHLATISSEAENKFVFRLTRRRWAWIGLTDKQTEGQWKWVTEEKLNFTNWMNGEPNNWGGREHFVAIGDGGLWNDLPINAWDQHPGLGFVCEWE